MKYESLV